MKKKKETDYEVGYGKPPKHTRFKPGKSGNPKGRPKGRKNFRTLVDEALSKKVTVSEGGRVRETSRAEAILTGLVAKALKGDARALETVLRLMQQHFPGGNEAESMPAPEPITVTFVKAKGRPDPADSGESDPHSSTPDSEP